MIERPVLENRFDYGSVERVLVDRKWRYGPEGLALPAITRILNATKSEESKQALEDWKARVGEEEAERISKESTGIGDAMHANLENWLLDTGKDQEGAYLAKLLTKLMQLEINKHCDEVWGVEVPVYLPGMYGGILDMSGVWRGKRSVIDFKNSRKPKRKEWIEDYRCQCGAYGIAHNALFNSGIEQAVVLVACWETGTVQEFVFSGDEYRDCETLWVSKLDEYYSTNPLPSK
tara:strand:- start:14063 stop:14761 length:699 start_codon:yes stop_codon:yes gene_type:complete